MNYPYLDSPCHSWFRRPERFLRPREARRRMSQHAFLNRGRFGAGATTPRPMRERRLNVRTQLAKAVRQPALCRSVGVARPVFVWLHQIPSLKARAPGCRLGRCAVFGRLLGPRRGAWGQHTWQQLLLASAKEGRPLRLG